MAEDARQADPQPALHAGMQRRGDDADPASQGVGILRARARSVRADLCGRRGFSAHHGAIGSPLHHGRAASRQIFPQDIRGNPQKARRAVLDRRANRRLVHRRRAESAVRNPDPAQIAPGRADVGARLMLVLLCCIWGITWPIMRIALYEVPPLSMRTVTAALGAMTLYAACRLQGRSLRVERAKDW